MRGEGRGGGPTLRFVPGAAAVVFSPSEGLSPSSAAPPGGRGRRAARRDVRAPEMCGEGEEGVSYRQKGDESPRGKTNAVEASRPGAASGTGGNVIKLTTAAGAEGPLLHPNRQQTRPAAHRAWVCTRDQKKGPGGRTTLTSIPFPFWRTRAPPIKDIETAEQRRELRVASLHSR